jgi:hypothetical protein
MTRFGNSFKRHIFKGKSVQLHGVGREHVLVFCPLFRASDETNQPFHANLPPKFPSAIYPISFYSDILLFRDAAKLNQSLHVRDVRSTTGMILRIRVRFDRIAKRFTSGNSWNLGRDCQLCRIVSLHEFKVSRENTRNTTKDVEQTRFHIGISYFLLRMGHELR